MSMTASLADYLPFLPRPKPRFVTEEGHRVHAMAAEFDSAPSVYHAAEQVRDAGYKKWDVYAPFPIHGIEKAMGQKPTKLPYLVMAIGMGGVFGGWALQYWITAVDYTAFLVQGKPFDAWEPFLMIIFEIGVLSAAFASLIGMLAFNGLPRWNHPVFSNEAFLETSQSKFMIVIEADDPSFDPDETRKLLEQSEGCGGITVIEDQS